MKKILSRIAQFILFTFFGLVLLYVAFRNVELKDLAEDFRRADYFYVALSFAMGYAAYVALGARWLIVVRSMGYPKTALSDTVASVGTAYFTNLFILRGGEVARCVALNRTTGIPLDRIIGTVITERVVDTLCLLSVIVLSFLFTFSDITAFFAEAAATPGSPLYHLVHDPWIAACSVVFILVLLAVLWLSRGKIRRSALFRKTAGFFTGIKTGLSAILNIRHKWLYISLTLFVWGMYYLMIFVMKNALPETAPIGWGQGLFILAVGGVAMVMPAQGGVGAYHLAIKAALALFAIPAITPEIALSFATLAHTTQLAVALVMGGISLGWVVIRSYRRGRTRTEKQEIR